MERDRARVYEEREKARGREEDGRGGRRGGIKRMVEGEGSGETGGRDEDGRGEGEGELRGW